MPTRVAAIDCGTNSIRLLVADDDGGRLTDVARRSRIVRLGQGVDETGRLAAEAVERVRVALVDYAALAAELGVERVRMAATSATRDAENREDFRAMVRATLGVEPEVISGREEAELSFTGSLRDLPDETAPPPRVVVDVGGGSTELVLGDRDTVRAGHSMDIGSVRLTERHLRDDPPTAAQVAAAEADIRAALAVAAGEVPVAGARSLIGVSGSVTTVAGLALGLTEYDPYRIHHARIPAADVRAVTADLLGRTRAQRAEYRVINAGRLDVIAAGALILREVVDAVGVAELVASEYDILDGLARSVRERTGGGPAWSGAGAGVPLGGG
ncbi:MAG TPA: Ppx/GppA phosphatase family protein, partial [Mycobacteriales bacterium]|nr:Ppx/GppA phosphatase family protein [Mycobacteriales bacterium]